MIAFNQNLSAAAILSETRRECDVPAFVCLRIAYHPSPARSFGGTFIPSGLLGRSDRNITVETPMGFLNGSTRTVQDEVIADRWSPNSEIRPAVLVVIARDWPVLSQTESHDTELSVRAVQSEPRSRRWAIKCDVAAFVSIKVRVNRNVTVDTKLSDTDSTRTAVKNEPCSGRRSVNGKIRRSIAVEISRMMFSRTRLAVNKIVDGDDIDAINAVSIGGTQRCVSEHKHDSRYAGAILERNSLKRQSFIDADDRAVRLK